jgi:hypothetical protein
MALVVLNGPAIEAGESLSDALDCTGGRVVRLTMASQWNSAPITFQISSDGEGYNNLHHANGKEIVVEVVPGAAVLVSADMAAGLAFLKIRSGTSAAPVSQRDRRQFAVAIEDGT